MAIQTYVRPDLTNGKAVYKGRRYWVVEINPTGSVAGISKSDADYIVWDGLYASSIGGAKQITGTRFKCFASIAQGCTCSDATDYKGIASTVVACWDDYFKHCFT